MMSRAELERRLDAVRGLMRERQLDAVLLRSAVGDTSPSNGNYRYFTGEQTLEQIQAAALFADTFPAAFYAPAPFSTMPQDTPFDYREAADVCRALAALCAERCGRTPRFGICADAFPASFLLAVQEAVPGCVFEDVSAALLDLRLRLRTAEEIACTRVSGQIADFAYAEALRVICRGAKEREIALTIEKAMRSAGADITFLLISSGPFHLANNGLPFLHPHRRSRRELADGDAVGFEITPAYDGYWTQLVRTVGVGKVDPDIFPLQRACREIVAHGAETISAGVPVSAVSDALEAKAYELGYQTGLPYGHLCGTDLTEERVSAQNPRPLAAGTPVILHPRVTTGLWGWGIFWGETYLTLPDGTEPLHLAGRELIVKE